MEGIKQQENTEELSRQIEEALGELKEKLSKEDVQDMLTVPKEADSEPSQWKRIEEKYESAKNIINAAATTLVSGSLLSFNIALYTQPGYAERIDPALYAQAMERMSDSAAAGSGMAVAAVALFVLGHAFNGIKREVSQRL